MAQSFHIWYIASSRGPLPKLFKLCPWGKKRPWLGGKLQMTSYLEPLMGIWLNSTWMVPGWSPTKIVQMVQITAILTQVIEQILFYFQRRWHWPDLSQIESQATFTHKPHTNVKCQQSPSILNRVIKKTQFQQIISILHKLLSGNCFSI